ALADGRPRGAHPEFPGAARHAAARVPVVHRPVAVVVQPVADFGRRLLVLLTDDRETVGASRRGGAHTEVPAAARQAAAPVPLRPGFSVARRLASLVSGWCFDVCSSPAALADGRPRGAHAELPRAARHAAARVPLVDDAVAVVVQPVADFGRRLLVLLTDDR